MIINLYNAETNDLLGAITEADLKVLADALEEESLTDTDYFISPDTIEMIGDGRATDHLLNLLRKAIGNSEGMEVRWQRVE
jgi:hypothetical protein